MFAISSAAVPVLLKVMGCAGLVVNINCVLKVRLEAENDATPPLLPLPAKPMTWGEPPALSAIMTAPVRLQAEVGVNITEIAQLELMARDVPQLLVSEKSPALAPQGAIFEIVNGAVPVFVRVICWAALLEPMSSVPKVRLIGLNLTAGAKPVPESGTLCGLLAALSVTVTLADRAPVVVGLKTTLMVQFAPASTCKPQLLVCLKSVASGRVIVIVLIFSVALPVLVKVTGSGLLEVPTTVLGKERLVGEKFTACPKLHPLRQKTHGTSQRINEQQAFMLPPSRMRSRWFRLRAGNLLQQD